VIFGSLKMIVTVPGAEIFYTTHGSGPPCLVISGIGTVPYERQMLAPLRERFQLVFVDLRGSGRSTGEPAGLAFDDLAADLDAVRADLGIERTAVLGHSILGMADMGRLTAEAAAFFEADASDERKRRLRENLAALSADASALQKTLAQTPMRFFDADFDATHLFADAVPRPLLQHLVGSLGPGWDVTAAANALRVPMLLALGRYDYIVPHILWDGFSARLPAAALELFGRSGHQPFFEEPERFAEVLTGWTRAVV
jgi:proline iminopeptidase